MDKTNKMNKILKIINNNCNILEICDEDIVDYIELSNMMPDIIKNMCRIEFKITKLEYFDLINFYNKDISCSLLTSYNRLRLNDFIEKNKKFLIKKIKNNQNDNKIEELTKFRNELSNKQIDIYDKYESIEDDDEFKKIINKDNKFQELKKKINDVDNELKKLRGNKFINNPYYNENIVKFVNNTIKNKLLLFLSRFDDETIKLFNDTLKDPDFKLDKNSEIIKKTYPEFSFLKLNLIDAINQEKLLNAKLPFDNINFRGKLPNSSEKVSKLEEYNYFKKILE